MNMKMRMIGILATVGIAASLGGAQISLAPAVLTNGFTGSIKMDISAINVGETLIAERFIDFNGNGVIDEEDYAVQRFSLTDDVAPAIGGVRNPNIPGDEDGGIPRQIRSMINMRLSELDYLSGNFLMRVSSPSNAFLPVTQSLTVSSAPTAQLIVGNVMTGAGVFVSNAWIVAEDPNTGEPVVGLAAGSTNVFLLKAPAGAWNLVALKPGYVSQKPTMVALHAISAERTNLVVEPGTVKISGVLHEQGTNTGLGSVSLMLRSDTGARTVGYTDAEGHFTCFVTPGQWTLTPNLKSLTVLGYVGPGEVWKVDATAGDVTTLDYALPKVTALVYGRVKNSINRNIVDLELLADTTSSLAAALAYTDPYGTFFLGLAEGAWYVAPYEVDMRERGLFGTGQTVTLANGEAQVLNLIYTQAAAHIRGQVVDLEGEPVSGLNVEGWNFDAVTAHAYTDIEGAFDLRVTAGRWLVRVADTMASIPLAVDSAVVQVADGDDVGGIVLTAAPVMGHLTGRFVDSTGAAIANMALVATNGLGMSLLQNSGDDGEFDFAVSSGNWMVRIEASGAQTSGLLSPQLNWAVTNANGVSNVICVARQATNTLSVSVVLDGQLQVNAMPFSANAGVNGTNYYQQAVTGDDGTATVPVFDGVWNVVLSAQAVQNLDCKPVAAQEAIILDAAGSVSFQLKTQGPTISPALVPVGFQSTGYEMVVAGEPRRIYRIDGSINLVDWFEVGRVTTSDGEDTSDFIDATADRLSNRFYRIVVEK
jgi:hypothetical protein